METIEGDEKALSRKKDLNHGRKRQAPVFRSNVRRRR